MKSNKNDANEIYKTETKLTDFENKFMVTKGKRGKDRLGVWDKHIHTTVYKIDK